MSETMVERVARALCKAEGLNPDNIAEYSERGMEGRFDLPPRWTLFTHKARAAIAAMREPTEGMLTAGNNYDSAGHSWGPKNTPRGLGEYITDSGGVYEAMIDAALKER